MQTSGLSQSTSALYDRDHPHMAGKTQGGFVFRSIPESELKVLRDRIGLQKWEENEGW